LAEYPHREFKRVDLQSPLGHQASDYSLRWAECWRRGWLAGHENTGADANAISIVCYWTNEPALLQKIAGACVTFRFPTTDRIFHFRGGGLATSKGSIE